VDSSLAYQGAGRTLPVAEISWLSAWATGGLKPDLVVLLDVDPAVGLTRVDSRGQGQDRLESESRAFHERVRYAFLDLAAADPRRYLVLDAARPRDEISTAVTHRLSSLLAPLPEPTEPQTPQAAVHQPPAPPSETDETEHEESPIEEMAEIFGIDDDERPGGPAAGSSEVTRRG
jgi:dTMP kinase